MYTKLTRTIDYILSSHSTIFVLLCALNLHSGKAQAEWLVPNWGGEALSVLNMPNGLIKSYLPSSYSLTVHNVAAEVTAAEINTSDTMDVLDFITRETITIESILMVPLGYKAAHPMFPGAPPLITEKCGHQQTVIYQFTRTKHSTWREGAPITVTDWGVTPLSIAAEQAKTEMQCPDGYFSSTDLGRFEVKVKTNWIIEKIATDPTVRLWLNAKWEELRTKMERRVAMELNGESKATAEQAILEMDQEVASAVRDVAIAAASEQIAAQALAAAQSDLAVAQTQLDNCVADPKCSQVTRAEFDALKIAFEAEVAQRKEEKDRYAAEKAERDDDYNKLVARIQKIEALLGEIHDRLGAVAGDAVGASAQIAAAGLCQLVGITLTTVTRAAGLNSNWVFHLSNAKNVACFNAARRSFLAAPGPIACQAIVISTTLTLVANVVDALAARNYTFARCVTDRTSTNCTRNIASFILAYGAMGNLWIHMTNVNKWQVLREGILLLNPFQ